MLTDEKINAILFTLQHGGSLDFGREAFRAGMRQAAQICYDRQDPLCECDKCVEDRHCMKLIREAAKEK